MLFSRNTISFLLHDFINCELMHLPGPFPIVCRNGIREKNTPLMGSRCDRPKEAGITDALDMTHPDEDAGQTEHRSPIERNSTRGENAMDDMRTEQLFGELLASDNLRGYLETHDLTTPTLAEYLRRELVKRGLCQSDVLREAGIDQTFGWYVFNGQRGMGRDNVLKLSFSMGFDARHANRALQAAGASALYPKNRRDAIVIYCLEHGYTLRKANDVLYAFGEECL